MNIEMKWFIYWITSNESDCCPEMECHHEVEEKMLILLTSYIYGS